VSAPATDRQADHPQLLRGVSSDPEIRARQTRGLKRGANLQHGAYGGERLEQLRGQHADALEQQFPNFDARRRVLLADRLARCQLVMAWCDEHGITPTAASKRGEAYPIVGALDRWEAQADVLLEKAGELERHTAANRTDPDTAAWIAYANGEGPKPDADPEQPPADAEVIAA
jgi:hypothetical protein